jgi:hypothetical protein
MKKLTLILLIGLVLGGCQEQSDNLMAPEPSPSSPAKPEFGEFQALQGTLEEIAQHVAENEQLLSGYLAGEMTKAPVVISDLGLKDRFPASVHDQEGRLYEIALETFAGSKLDSGEPLRVALDPDRFYAEDAAFPAFVFDKSRSQIMVENISRSDAAKTLSYRLVFVTLEDRTEIAWSKLITESRIFQEYQLSAPDAPVAKGSQSTILGSSSTSYLCVTKIRLNTDKDDFSAEEFELFIREGTGSSNYYRATTSHKFDGKTRSDAAGRLVKYPDINYINTTYVMASPIALWPLSNTTPISIAPIEDDYVGGEHRNWAYPNVLFKTIDEDYHRPTNSSRFNVRWGFRLVGVGGSFNNNDDIYENGTFSEWTISNTPSSEVSIQLGDVQIWFKKMTF